MKNEKRRLAAIMFTDIVGFAAMTRRNEKLSLQLLERHHKLLRSCFVRFTSKPCHRSCRIESAGRSIPLAPARVAATIGETDLPESQSPLRRIAQG
jgi:class 3 adenylate cyclase